jgi:hypothetical protein
MPRTFKLVGPNAGKDIVLGYFHFVNGAISVPDNDASHVGAILTRFHSAVPAEEFEAAQKAYEEANPAPKPAETSKETAGKK